MALRKGVQLSEFGPLWFRLCRAMFRANARHLRECAGEEPKSADTVPARNGNKLRLVRAVTWSAPKHEAARMFLGDEH